MTLLSRLFRSLMSAAETLRAQALGSTVAPLALLPSDGSDGGAAAASAVPVVARGYPGDARVRAAVGAYRDVHAGLARLVGILMFCHDCKIHPHCHHVCRCVCVCVGVSVFVALQFYFANKQFYSTHTTPITASPEEPTKLTAVQTNQTAVQTRRCTL
jgi:hypothetical protein